jgi:hypothetical protein
MTLAKAECNLLIALSGLRAAEDMEKRLGQNYIKLYLMFRPEGIRENYKLLSEYIKLEIDCSLYENELKVFINEHARILKGRTA